MLEAGGPLPKALGKKAREAAFDVKESVLVEPANVASFQPTIAQDFCGPFGIVQISFKNVCSAQPKHSGIVQRKVSVGLRFANFRCHSRRESANRSQTAGWLYLFPGFSWFRVGQIDAYHRRSLGQPVAFKNFLVETLLKMAGQIERQLFGPGYNEAQAEELLRLAFAQVYAQESGRRKEERQFISLDQCCVLRAFERIWIRDDADAFN